MSKKDEALVKIKELAPKGKITCTEVRQVAADYDLELSEMGNLCNEIEIKICACEIGCF